jgi:hypothetical protein
MLHFKTLLSWLVYLTDVPIIAYFAKSQENNCHSVSITVLFGKHPYLGMLTICMLGRYNFVPMTWVLGHSWHSVYQMMLVVPAQANHLVVKHK